jgi:hypothetical protein
MSTWFPRCRVMLSVVFDGRGLADSKPLLVPGMPRTCTVTRNGFHDADTWSLEFDARSLPFDPDIVRSVAAVIYMWGAESATDDTQEWAIPDYEMVRGLADEVTLSLGEDGQMFRLEGRDYTGLLLDADWNPKFRPPAGMELDAFVQGAADDSAPPGTRARFEVVWLGPDQRPTTTAGHRNTKRKGLWVKPGTSVWDVIYNTCLRLGFVAYVEGETIFIAEPNTQTERSIASAPRMVYGRNLASLTAERKLTKEKVPQVKVVAYDPSTGQRIEVVYPKAGDKVVTGLGMKKDEIVLLPAPAGVRDRDALLRYAQVRYVDMARAEAVYRAETMDLESADGQELLRLEAGGPVALQFDPWNREAMRALSEQQRVEHLLALGYSPQVASLVAQHLELVDQFRQPYFLRQAEYNWSVDDGLRVSFEAVNYASESRGRALEGA